MMLLSKTQKEPKVLVSYRQKQDYMPFAYELPSITLDIWLEATSTRVVTHLVVQPLATADGYLCLDGENINLLDVRLNGRPHLDYQLTLSHLIVKVPDTAFELTIESEINPQGNLELEGLYLADGVFCTQCEAEGFRKITFFPDRPDVLSIYTVTLHANKTQYPVLLSNGNPIAVGDDADNGHWCTWHDPFPKPCYLFALVAGNLEFIRDEYTTASNRTIELRLFTLPGQALFGHHALVSLKKAMRWDEQAYGLEYDLAYYNIVATDFFNVEAMENKGLNIFNSEYVLANSETASDCDYYQIESVIAHEYFHNWTGNRVTLRDWFQLTLKEGLTVYRDQSFSCATYSPIVARLMAVKKLWFDQFIEDSGPFCHAPRPQVVSAMDNFYTTTVYEKGAEIIRMLVRLMGEKSFKQGVANFIRIFDGQGATCEDFLTALQPYSQYPLRRMIDWFDTPGRPKLNYTTDFAPDTGIFTLTCRQVLPTSSIAQTTQSALLLPICIELIFAPSKYTSFQSMTIPHTLVMSQQQQSWHFNVGKQAPTLAIFCDLSAPVECEQVLNDEQRREIILFAEDPIVRWTSIQDWAAELILGLCEAHPDNKVSVSISAYCQLIQSLCRSTIAPELIASLLELPPAQWVLMRKNGDIHHVVKATETLERAVLRQCYGDLMTLWSRCQQQVQIDQGTNKALWRLLYDQLLKWLFPIFDSQRQQRLVEGCLRSANMNEQLGILNALVYGKPEMAIAVLDKVFLRWQSSAQGVNKWFALQAQCATEDSVKRIESLLSHHQFNVTNPNNVKALLVTFINHNLTGFHCQSGAGYDLLTRVILAIDKDNPQLAATLIKPFLYWSLHSEARRKQIYQQLTYIDSHSTLSQELSEKVVLALNAKVDGKT
jgi:aminopeptidase N